MRFLYVMDPMCAWCYGFQPELEAFLAMHPSASVDWIMGGLAPDTNEPMDDGLRQTISSYWRQIEAKTQVRFNHDFWANNTPYRSTYMACRAVISAERIKGNSGQTMAKAIQNAYYQKATNPALTATLADCADAIGLNKTVFLQVLRSPQTEQEFQQHLATSQQLQVSGFPALFYLNEHNHAFALTLGFCKVEELERRFKQIELSSER